MKRERKADSHLAGAELLKKGLALFRGFCATRFGTAIFEP